MEKLNNFRLKTWHFVLLIVVLSVSTNILANMTIKKTVVADDILCCIDIDDSNKVFLDTEIPNVSFILMYKEESNLCKKMEYNISLLSRKLNNDIVNFYKLNTEKYPEECHKHNVSGTPTILVYKNGKEFTRIMGVVSVSNLEMIYKRAIK